MNSSSSLGERDQEGEEKRCLNSELWHACAGPLVCLPTVSTRVVYFPQGHSEQVAASTNKEVDGHIPNYPNLPPQLICQLHNVTMHADVETDEVYAQMTLQPLSPQEQKDTYVPIEMCIVSKQPTNYFCKTLTASDTSTHGGFSVPRRAAEKVFPPLDFSQQPPAQELIARDIHDIEWKFRHIFRGQPKRHLLTTGWSVFISAKRIVAGDSVIFIWNEKNQLLLGIRRASRPPTIMPSSVLSSDSMHIGLLAAAAHATATNSRFTIFYNPRACPSEFVELRLLRCTLPFSHHILSPNRNPNTLIEFLINSIERGNYSVALASPAAQLVFKFAESFEYEDSIESADRFYGEVERSVELFLRGSTSASEAWLSVLDSVEGDADGGGSELDAESRFAIVMCLGVAALLGFARQNVTGPVGMISLFPVPFPKLAKNEAVNGGGMWDIWAQNQLMTVGCGLLGKFMHLQYIVYGKILLSKARFLSMEQCDSSVCGIRSISWWLSRLIFLQQRILDELSSSLYNLLLLCKKEILSQFGELDCVINYWGSLLCEGEAAEIVSMAQLEAGIIEHKYGWADSSRLHLELAEEACGMHHSVTGVLGFRTLHQVDPKAQLVLVPNLDNHADLNSTKLPEMSNTIPCSEDKMNSYLHDKSDVLIKPRLVESDGGPNGNSGMGNGVNLTANQQAVILAECLLLQSSSNSDELSMWKMAPYIEAIDGQHQSFHAIRFLCNIFRVRWESTRSRTKERALLIMDKLAEDLKNDVPDVAKRIRISFGVYLPTIPALRKEYGELLVRCGMIGEALRIFEDLELWDNLIYCYRLLDKKAAAVDLIKERLVHTPTDPMLWCSFGDVTNTDAYYQKALEVSNNKSTRAMRSLARSAYNRGDYETSKILWESAMSINSLFPDGWFALGTAALKAQDFDKALDAFTHAIQIDPENGEAWNNIAFLHMRNKKSRPAFIAFKEALKFRRNTWQLWENYSRVAIEVGDFAQALEATKHVLDLSNNKQVDVELLDTVTRTVEESISKSANSASHGVEGNDISAGQTYTCHSVTDSSEVPSFYSKGQNTNTHSNGSMSDTSEEHGHSKPSLLKPRESELLMDMLGSILAQIVKNGGGADIWGLYARWHKIKGNLTMCSEALLKQVRSYQGSDLWHDRDRFKKFAHASLQLCKVYMEIASSLRSRRELMTAEMHLRNSVKQAAKFSDMQEYRDLEACHEEIKKLLAAPSAAA